MINIYTRLLEQVTDANQLFLLMHIAKRFNATTNQCFHSNSTLQNDTGWSRTKVYEVRQKLMNGGYISILPLTSDDGTSLSSCIKLTTNLITIQ